MRRVSSYLLLAGLLGLVACTSTKQSRISENEALFNSYTPHEQYLIRSGQIDIGFDKEQVRMAFGYPDSSRASTNAGGTQEVWEYSQIEPNYGAFGGATIRRGADAGVAVSGSPTKRKVLKRVLFDRNTGEVVKFESFN